MVCFFLALVLVLGNLPVTALAEQTPETEETVQTQTPKTESTEGPEPIPETTGSSENSMIAVITEPAVTEEAVLTVYPLADAVVDENGTATFFVQAFGAAITYQWQVLDGTPDSADWKDVENAVGPELTISGLETDAAYPTRSYRCVVTSGDSRVTTNAAGIVSPADDGSANTVTAAASHTHPICGDVNCTEGHTNYTWTAWNGTSSISGTRFYLTQDATRTSYYTITGTVHICLNGHTLSTGGDAPGFSVSEGSTLLITDCQGTGEVCSDANTSSCSSTEVGIENEGGTFTLWNGTISGSYAGIDSIGGKVYIRGGSVQARDGQGIILEEDAALTMSDGSVSGSDAGILDFESTVDFESTASASISGGSVSADYGQALSMRGAADISGGSFHGSTDICGNQLYLSGTPEFDSVWAYSALSLQNKAGTKSYTGGGFRLRSGVSGGSAAVVNVSDTGIASRITIYNGLYTGVAAGRLTASGTDLILQTPSSSGEAGELLWALYGNGDFFLLGSGAMPNYSHPDQTSNQAPWKSVRSSIRSLYVSEGVTSIGSYAFYGSGLESVSFGSASLTLGNYCFAGCDSLKNIDFGSGTVSPGESVFSDCNALTSVTIPGTVVMNGQYSGAGSGYQLFFSCDSLETATVECGYIGPFVFEGCYQMKQATFTNPDVRFYFVDTGSGHPFHANSSQMNVAVTGCLCSQANVLVQKSEGRYNVNLTFTQIAGDTTRHTERVLPGVPAECEATGLTEGKDCSVCGYVFQEQETIPAPGHTEVVDEAVAATCTEDGLTEGKHCSVCGKVLIAQQIVPAGHQFVDDVCTVCGAVRGSCGENLTYILTTDGVLTISGSGEMTDYRESAPAPWYAKRTKITSVVLKEGVTSIGSYAFSACWLKEISMPESLRTIGSYAFQNCTRLTAADIPAGVTGLGSYAFNGCTSLTSVTMPERLSEISSYLFQDCSMLSSVTIPAGVTSIGSSAFQGCSGLTSMVLPEGITTIGSYAFFGCSGLTSVNIPNGVTTIGTSAFCRCSGLTEILLPESVVSIGFSVFSGCSGLTAITIPEGISSISSGVFSDCSGLTTVTIPEGVLSIGPSAFEGCSNLTTVTIPEGVTSIWDFAFSRCTSLISVVIPEGVTTISHSVFSGCTSLTTVTLPEGVTTIGDLAFQACSSLTSITIPESVTSIGNSAFWGSGLTAVTLPEGVTSIGDYAFRDCSSLTSITIPKAVTSIGHYAFDKDNPTVLIFWGDGFRNPENTPIGSSNITAYYPKGNTTWTEEVRASFGTVTWKEMECVKGIAHEAVVVKGYGATCTEDGLSDGSYCAACGEILAQQVIIPAAHTVAIDKAKAATCTQDGLTEGSHCSACGEVLVAQQIIPASGHTEVLDDGMEATCTEDGLSNGSHCSVCGEVLVAQQIIPAPGHTKVIDEKREATCTQDGLTEGSHCSVCGEIFVAQQIIPASGHTEVIDEKRKVTCTQDGLTEGKHCAVCGEVLVAQQIIPAPGHTGVIDEGVEATCTQDGLTEGKHCSVCGEILVKQEVIPADHCFEKGVCKYCGMMAGPCGANGDHLSYTLTVDGTLTILGSGEMMSFYSQGAPWYQSREKITTVILPEGLTSIGRYAFQDCVGLRQVALPQSVKQIEAFAFESCTALETIQFGDQLVTIGAYAFHDCDSLRSVDLPQSLTTLGSYAFFSCDNLETAALPNGLKSIGTDCFYDCQKLQMIDMSAIPDVITEKTTLLTGKAVLPKALVQAAGGKANQSWTVRAVEGDETDPWSIASFTVLDGKTYLETMSSGSFVLETFDSHSGVKGSKVVQVQATTLIRPEGAIVLQGGDSVQLSVWRMPAGTELSARWSLAAGDENYAELSDTGLLTAKFLAEPRTVTVTAEPEGGDSASATVRILPRSTGICIELDGSILGETLDVDLAETDMLQFLAHVVPEGTAQEVCWSSSNLAVASVEETGAVTFISPGTAVIRASSAVDPDLYTEVTLRVFYLDAAEALKATAQIPEIGLQPGQIARIVVSGEREIDASDLIFSIPPTQKSIASVDSQGILTAGNTPGTVTVTAALRGDPLARKATISVTVVPMQALALKLTPILPDQTASLEVRNGELIVAVSSAVLEEGDYTFGLSAQIRGYTGEWFPAGSLTWESTDGAMAAVTPGEGGTASVTIFQGAGGECAIQAAATDQAKVQSRIRICVRDNSPRLEASKLTLNSYRTSGATLGLLESYGNTIEEVRLYESDRLSDRFAGEADGAVLTLRATQTVKNGTYALRLEADCADGLTYSYPLQVKVANSLPAVTVKQTGKLNLFYLDSTVPLSVTAAGQAISGMTLTDTDDFTVEYTGGAAALRYSDAFRDSPAAKPDLRASLQVYLEDYRVPATAAITIGAVTTAPKLSLSPESSIINTALNPENPSAEIRVWDKTEGCYLDLSNAEVRYTADFAQLTYWADTLTLTLTGGSGGTASIWIRQEGWTQSVKLTHKVTVSDKLPTLKLASSTLKLNNCFTRQTAETAVTLSQGNLTLSGMVITSTAKEGTAVAEEAGKLKVYYAPDAECLRAEIADPDNAPQAGNYTFSCRGVLSDGSEFPGGTLKVTVSNTLPKVKLSSTTLKLNRYLAGAEKAGAVVSVTGDPGYTVAGFEELNAGLYDWLIYDEGVLSVQLPDSDVAIGKSSFRLTPVLRHEATGQEAALPTALTLTVQVYASDKLGVSLSAKGKLDTLDPDCAIDYTVSKLTNCSGSIDGVSLEGPDGDKFRALLDDSGAKPVIRLTLAEGEEYATNVTYKVRFNLTICGQDVLSPVMSFKVAQSALKLTASAKTLTLFQSQSVPLTCRLTLTAPAGAEIGDVSVGEKSSPELIAALGSDGFSAEINGGTAVLSLSPEDTGALKAGKSYTLYLDVTPENNASNVKPSQVKLTVKVMK